MITKKQLSKVKWWHYCYISRKEVMTMSGWKLYIYGETIDDSFDIGVLLTDIAAKYDVTMKIATQHIIDSNKRKAKMPCWSTGVIYLNADVFREGKIKQLVKDIKDLLKSYNKSGAIKGAKSLYDNKIHYRYDLKKPIDPAKGVLYEDYLTLYRGEYGEFNISGNKDIEQLLNQ